MNELRLVLSRHNVLSAWVIPDILYDNAGIGVWGAQATSPASFDAKYPGTDAG